jgi:Putative beta barrel porin-7 (BBP7)
MTGASAYRISAYNNLFGGQLGARISQACNNWSYDLTGKAGVYGNDIFTSQTVGDFSGFTLRHTKENVGQLAFLGDLELNGNYQFTPNWFLRGGYQVMWVEGLALAPNQLDFTNTPASGTHVDKTGGLFMHGAHAGLMARW